MTTRVTEGATRERNAGGSPLPRACTALTKSEEKERLLAAGAPNGNFRENICSEDDLRSRIFGKFVVKFLVCLPLLGFSNIDKMV